MTEPTKPETAVVEDTPAPEKEPEKEPTQEEIWKSLSDDPRASIYARADAIKRARQEALAAPPTEEAPPETPPEEEASAPEEKPPAVEEPQVEELTPEQFAERFKHVKVKGKFAGEEAVVDARELIKNHGLSRHLTKRLQEVARKEEALGAGLHPAAPLPPEYRPSDVPPQADKALRYWNESEVAAKFDELFAESPFKAQSFLNTYQAERQRAQAENEKTRMDTAERDFLALHADMGPSDYEAMKSSFSDPDFFRRHPDVDLAFQRRDYYGALELTRIKLVEKNLNDKLKAIQTAQEAAKAEEQKRIDLKKKGSVIRTASKPEAKPKPEYKPLSRAEYIAKEAERRRALQGIPT